jgi:hypothetical protein
MSILACCSKSFGSIAERSMNMAASLGIKQNPEKTI